jgi:hypothetical protein
MNSYRPFSQQQREDAQASLSSLELEAIYTRLDQLDRQIDHLGLFSGGSALCLFLFYVIALANMVK